MPAAIAIAAHPDDIEFLMAGTLLQLREAGWETHYFNLCTGNCGSMVHTPARTRAIRRREAQTAAKILGARWHPPLADDLEIVHTAKFIRQVAAVIRQVKPTILLTHSPQDYMEDHMNTSRVAVSAAFVRGMPNYRSLPPRKARLYDLTVYHAMPHGLRDELRRRVTPETFVDTTAVHPRKRAALAAHQSQKSWLDASQGMDSYLIAMDDMSREVGRMSKRFQFAEGWRRHSHLGFCAEAADPLRDVLGKGYWLDPAYARLLEKGR
jgi:LmbE family N-acetylglucosaminyl deacetylase